ncbi:cyclase [Arthrobacter sp. Leaf337]|uniref:SRPBCC family protein n=1 Tax=unclassified Arthrobacter TaxID=235627 RepID=UPI0006F71491|nr:SRPBCC family protein [Arthrobacter sp. Leaf337]KQR67171.1 cyclase [Arthrobacter sp. Leaf337]
MATVQESINVSVPLSQAYNQWTQFEDFPHFMSGVEDVRQLDDTTVHFQTSIGGVKREYDARITVQQPDQRVTWESIDEPRNAGTVWFEALNPTETKVSVELAWEPDSAVEKVGAAVGLDSRQVASDLKRFKKFIEEREVETGAWRERVSEGAVSGAGAATAAGTTAEIPLDAATAVPLEEEVGYDAVPTEQPVNTDPDMATEPPFGKHVQR